MLLQGKRVLSREQKQKSRHTLREKCPYEEFFWSVFSRILTEYGKYANYLSVFSPRKYGPGKL